MSELTRKEKVYELLPKYNYCYATLVFETDEEINDLYDQHFNQVTLEDFEGFKKVCSKFRVMVFNESDFDNKKPLYIDQIKKELNL